MDADVYAQLFAEEREWDLRGLSSERFLRQLRLACSLGLLDALLAEAERQGLQRASRLAALSQSAEAGTQSMIGL
jgi:hypothetical protein